MGQCKITCICTAISCGYLKVMTSVCTEHSFSILIRLDTEGIPSRYETSVIFEIEMRVKEIVTAKLRMSKVTNGKYLQAG